MKGRTLIFIKALIPIITIVFIFTIIEGCTSSTTKIKEKVHDALGKEPASIEEAAICEKVDDNSAPVNTTNIFPSDTKAIYLSVKVKDFTPEDKLSVNWYYLETGVKIDTQEFTTNKSGSGYIGFNIKIAEGLPSGKYSTEIYLNDDLVETIKFSVR